MSVRVSAEEMETSGSEKVLAMVLAAFMAVGFIWVLFKLDEIGKPEYQNIQPDSALSAGQRQTIAGNDRARFAVNRFESAAHAARRQLELKREAFRTALEAGQPTSTLEAEYRAAQARYAEATEAVSNARSRVSATQPAADAARQALFSSNQQSSKDFEAKQDSHDRQTFVLRLLWVVGLLGAGYRLLGRLRVRQSRYLPVGLAWVGAAALTGLVMAVDYAGDYIEFSEAGPLAISVAGVGITLVAFVALQRFLRRRVPVRRVRKGQCPFCGFPVAAGEHCEGCGRAVQAPCSACRAPRRVGTQHCATCGAA